MVPFNNVVTSLILKHIHKDNTYNKFLSKKNGNYLEKHGNCIFYSIVKSYLFAWSVVFQSFSSFAVVDWKKL